MARYNPAMTFQHGVDLESTDKLSDRSTTSFLDFSILEHTEHPMTQPGTVSFADAMS